jgi:8-oxo-dGTP pyrophosphatase MutT (NUDIX family)
MTVPVRDAATVALLRDGEDGIEAWLLTRVRQMTFAAGMSVFPGGRVEPADADLPFAGSAEPLARRFGCAEELARILLGAAVRETFEETGVLLTTPTRELAGARADVEAGRVGFGELLREHELTVPVDALAPWARWVTPAGEARRYDTRFFVAALPDGARADDVSTESSSAAWVPVGQAIEEQQRGDRRLMPPTMATLTSLLDFATVADAMAAAPERSIAPVHPKLVVNEDGSVEIELPDGSLVSMPRGLKP